MMNEINQQVGRARRSINTNRFIKALIFSMTAGLAVGCLGFALPRVWAIELTQTAEQLKTWQMGWLLGGIGIAILAAVIWSMRSAVRNNLAAIELDERFGLKERVSSALSLTPEDAATPAGRSLLEDAESRVSKVDVRDAFSLRLDRRAFMPLIPAAILVALFFVPARTAEPVVSVTETVAEQQRIESVIEETKKRIEEQSQRLSEKGLEKAAEDIKAMAREFDQLKADNSELKKETLVKLNDIKKQLDEEKSKLSDVEQLKKEFSRLKDISSGPGKELAEAFKDGDFDKAQKVIKDLAEKIKEGKLSENEMKKLADNLGELAKAVDELAKKHEEDKQNLEDKIKQAIKEGDPQKAAELQEKLDKVKEQDQQIKKMQEMADQLKKCQSCMGGKKPGDKPDKNGQGGEGKQPTQGKEGEGGGMSEQDLQDAIKALEGMSEIMDEIRSDQDLMEALRDLEEDLAECKGECQGEGQGNGKSEKKSKGDFAKGAGRGSGERDIAEDETKGYKTQVKAKLQKGQTIVAGEADGENAKVESVIEAREAVRSSMAKESDPVEDQQLPKAQREHARQYFEKLRKGG
jgi:hypothetical protein